MGLRVNNSLCGPEGQHRPNVFPSLAQIVRLLVAGGPSARFKGSRSRSDILHDPHPTAL